MLLMSAAMSSVFVVYAGEKPTRFSEHDSDGDGDGYISVQEYKIFREAYRRQREQEGRGYRYRWRVTSFVDIDTDADQRISETEMRDAINRRLA